MGSGRPLLIPEGLAALHLTGQLWAGEKPQQELAHEAPWPSFSSPTDSLPVFLFCPICRVTAH